MVQEKTPGPGHEKFLGLWVWGHSVSDRCRIGLTWDGLLALWSESHEGQTIFGLIRDGGQQWQVAELFFSGRVSGFVLRFRMLRPDLMEVLVRFPNGTMGEQHIAKHISLPRPPFAALTSSMGIELEMDMVRVAGCSVRAWHRPAGAPRAPLAVVLCPGLPSASFPSFYSGSRLITELEMAFAERQVPVVCFDYRMVGTSSTPIKGSRADPARWKQPTFERAYVDSLAVINFAKEHLGDQVVVCGFSLGALCSLSAAAASQVGGLGACIALSMGCDAGRLGGRDADKERFKEAVAQHGQLSCKALYVCGDGDTLAPVDEVHKVMERRPDGGAEATLAVVRSDSHELSGLEEDVAALCCDWLLGTEEDHESTDCEPARQPSFSSVSTAPPDGGETTPSTPSSDDGSPLIDVAAASDPAPLPGADAGEEPSPEKQRAANRAVRVEIRQWRDSRSPALPNIFHADLPGDAVVGELRKALGPDLPDSTDIVDSERQAALQDSDPLPESVIISAFAGQILPRMRLTKGQSVEIHRKLRAVAAEPAMQRRLDKLEKDTNGAQGKYRLALAGILMGEVLPSLAGEFGFPKNHQGVQCVMGSIEAHSEGDVEMLRTWLEVETLFRNQAKYDEVRRKIAEAERRQREAES